MIKAGIFKTISVLKNTGFSCLFLFYHTSHRNDQA